MLWKEEFFAALGKAACILHRRENTMERQKTKLGARILSKSELNAILPNAESVYEQIEVFRSNIPDGSGETEQKTNNIGIMGSRGTGKTSILLTFHENLKQKSLNYRNEKKDGKSKNGDIILPIIVPENMSSGTTLMDVVLGMLKPVVEERKEIKTAGSGDCIYSGRDSLEKQYNELIKQYCYIKKDYRNILIQQFTTEQNYVDKTKEVFNSDSEFIKLFDQFVTRLLRNEEKPDENAMIFLFIDDIDLSADRSMDVVRTLLSYLSHPRIVTFISGDIEIFEEALTLEFLRQEKALDSNVFNTAFYSVSGDQGDSRLLERKKNLAYEYLKKIIPPVYRRTVKYWSLEERGNYRISEGEGREQKSLVELLVEVSKERLEKSYFVYSEDGVQKNLSLAFHMLDETSRGLNNVYNVLQELCGWETEERNAEENKEDLLLWRLIETVVDSKAMYAEHKTRLFKDIVVLGQGRVQIHFENAYKWLYKQGADASSKDRFAIFFLVDFAAGLFSREKQDSDIYRQLKNKVIQEYLSDEAIDGRIASKRYLIPLGEEQKSKDKNFNPIQLVLRSLLEQGDFIFVLHLIRYLGREEIYNILIKDEGKQYSEREAAYKVAGALTKAVWAMNETEEDRRNYLAQLYLRMRDTMLSLFNMLSLDPKIIYGRQLADNVNITAGGKLYVNESQYGPAEANYWNVESLIVESGSIQPNYAKRNLLWAEYENRNLRYWIYYKRCLRESTGEQYDIFGRLNSNMALSMTKTAMNLMQEAMDQYKVKKLGEVDYDALLTEKDDENRQERQRRHERQVIKQIDEDGLWNTPYVKDKVFPYIKNERIDFIFKTCRCRIILDATELLTGEYYELKNCEKGSSGKALIHSLVPKVQDVLLLPTSKETNRETNEVRRFADGKYYLRLEQSLVIQYLLEEFLRLHYRAKYGTTELRKLLMKIRELPVVIHTSGWNAINEELKKREDNFFEEKENMLKDQVTRELERKETLLTAIKVIREQRYDSRKQSIPSVRDLLIEYLNVPVEKDCIYFEYLVQREQIQEMIEDQKRQSQEMQGDRGESMAKWEDMEPVISPKEYQLIFHSYLRYLQGNDKDAEKAGAQAEDIATLAGYMLDGETIADKRIQNEVYEIISKKLELTEEEFDALF